LTDEAAGTKVNVGEIKSEDYMIQETTVHGMVIADDCFGEVYMVPLDEIVTSMEDAMSGMSISLPSDTHEIIRLLNEQSFRMDRTAVEHPKLPKIKIEPEESEHARFPEQQASDPSASEAKDMSSSSAAVPPPAPAISTNPATTTSTSARPRTSWYEKFGTIWYCSECGDGPKGTWNDVCMNCEHEICSLCHIEMSNEIS
jgi:hypothetical protein